MTGKAGTMRRAAAWVAVAGLLFRLVLAAWHVHLPVFPAGAATLSAKLPAQGPAKPDPLPHACDLCQALQGASTLAGADAPALHPPAAGERRLAVAPAARLAGAPPLGFRSRAPPLA